jgi:hypothetical protein
MVLVVGAGRLARRWWIVLSLVGPFSVAGVAAATGTVIFDGAPGTKAPPRQVDGITLTKFGRDHRARGLAVTSVNGPTGQVAFSQKGAHLVVKPTKAPNYWQTWSHHYRGDVYFFPSTTTLTLPPHTAAFYFYVEPNDRQEYKATATSGGVSSGPVTVNGFRGAKFFGFIAKGGAQLISITVRSTDRPNAAKHHSGGFAIGEFGIHKG